jgi:hypothetical protein
MSDLARTGWHYDMMQDAWINGRHAIGAEIVASFPWEKVQQHAVDLAGEPLPETVIYEFADDPEPRPVCGDSAHRHLGPCSIYSGGGSQAQPS